MIVKNTIVKKEEMVKTAKGRKDIVTTKEMDMIDIDLLDQLVMLIMIQERNKNLPGNKKKMINQVNDQIDILVLLKIKKHEIAVVTEIENIVRKNRKHKVKVLVMTINQNNDRNIANHMAILINRIETILKMVEDTIGKKTVLKCKMDVIM